MMQTGEIVAEDLASTSLHVEDSRRKGLLAGKQRGRYAKRERGSEEIVERCNVKCLCIHSAPA